MKKRNLLTSIVASSVLVGTLVLNGCGGSNSGSDGSLPNLGEGDTKASGTSKIVADSNGNVNVPVSLVSDVKEVQVAQATIETVSNDGAICCTQASDNCSVTAKQISACGIDTSDTAFVEAKKHVKELIAGAGDRYDDTTDMIVTGGLLTINSSGFNETTMALSINMIKCGSAFDKNGNAIKAGFANEGHMVDVYVKDANGIGKWIRNIKIKDGKILISSNDLGAITLPATFMFYSIKKSNKDNTTGLSGSTGAAGY